MQGHAQDGQPQGSYQLQQAVTVINQPQPFKCAVLGQPQNIRQWTTGMFDCFDDLGECLYCLCCQPCSNCALAEQMDECVLGPCCIGSVFTTAMRTKLRAQFGIEGSVLEDYCAICWCPCCTTFQMSREIKNIGYRPYM